ncbi:hypothetical protein ACTWQL_09055 [Pseudalkalibacillus sp. R45]
MAKKEKLNEEAAWNNNLDAATLKNDVELSEELQDKRVEKDVNPKRIKRS